MKRTTILSVLLMLCMLSFGQRQTKQAMSIATTPIKSALTGIEKTKNQASNQKIRKAEGDELVTPPASATIEEWEYYAGTFAVSGSYGWQDYTSNANKEFQVAFDGNDIYIKGIAFYFPEAWVKGTLDGTTLTVPNGQYLGFDDYGDEFLNGEDGTTQELCDIVFEYDAANKTLTLDPNIYILECEKPDDTACFSYWNGLQIGVTIPEDFTLVTPPDGLTTTDMPVSGKDRVNSEFVSGTASVGVDGDNVYIKGLVPAAPEAWVKGVRMGNDFSFDKQYIGEINGVGYFICGYNNGTLTSYSMYYDEARNTYELQGIVVLSQSSKNFNQNEMYTYYTGLFVGERPDLVTPPADLATEALALTGEDVENQQLDYTVNVGIDGNDVYFQGLTNYLPEAWVKGTLNEEKTMVTFPAGQYIGIEPGSGMAIYMTGLDDSGVAVEATMSYQADFNVFTLNDDFYINGRPDVSYYYDVIQQGAVIGEMPDASWVAKDQNYENAQDVTSFTITEGVTGTLAKNGSNNAPKYYETGEAVRLYSQNTLTITSTNKEIGKIVFTMTGNENQMLLEADKGDYTLVGTKGTWTGQANEITFTVPETSGKQARIQRIDIYYFDYSSTIVEAPADLETEAYYYKGTDIYYQSEDTREVQVGFYGENNDEVYIQGLSYFLPEAWVKGKMVDNKVTIPGWYLGEYASFFGTYDIILEEMTLDFDPETNTFSTDYYATVSKTGSIMDEYSDVTITKIIEKAGTPAQPEITSYTRASSYDYIRMNVPAVDEEGNPMLTSKISYQLYVDVAGEVSELVFRADEYENLEADMTVIPYTFSDDWDFYSGGSTIYLNHAERESWDKIGVKSIYTGGGETHETAISWFDIREYLGIENNVVTTNNNNGAIYNLQGVRVNNATQKGIYIQNGKKFVVK